MKVTVLNFGDSDRVFPQLTGKPASVPVGGHAELNLTPYQFKRIAKSQGETVIAVASTRLSDRMVGVLNLLRGIRDMEYDAALMEAKRVLGNGKLRNRPSINDIMIALAAEARHEARLAAEESPLTNDEQNDNDESDNDDEGNDDDAGDGSDDDDSDSGDDSDNDESDDAGNDDNDEADDLEDEESKGSRPARKKAARPKARAKAKAPKRAPAKKARVRTR